MIIGVPKEIKADEYRVGLAPAGVDALVRRGHAVLVEAGAGLGSGIADAAYAQEGGQVLAGAAELYRQAEMIVKVKEPQPAEYDLVREGQIVFTYFHFAASRPLTEALLTRRIVAVAYETVTNGRGRLPLLEPMSEIAGRMAVQAGARYLEKPLGGKGRLLGGVPGVAPGRVLIIGGGIVGANAAKMAAGLRADVTILDLDLERLRYLDDIMPGNVRTLYSSRHAIAAELARADLVIGAVLVVGARAPKLVTRDMLGLMEPGTVVVDVAVDQGGSFETTRPTTHNNPVFTEAGIVHYCVANMPGAVPQSSTFALTNATLPYALQLADKGWATAARDNPALAAGLNLVAGKVTLPALAETFGMPYESWK